MLGGPPGFGATAITVSGCREWITAAGGAGAWGIIFAVTNEAMGGAGGASAFGPGGQPSGYISPYGGAFGSGQIPSSQTAGPAISRGSGGGGADNQPKSNAVAGGNGASGVVLVHEYA
jgi:hypothetical protein